MEDNNLINGEDENLNSDTLEIEHEKTYSEEDLEIIKKQILANSERGVQKLLKEIKLLKSAIRELSNIADNESRLIELVDEDRELAFLLLEEYFAESLDEYKTRIGYTCDLEDPKRYYKRLERESSKKAEDRVIELEKDRFIKKLQMTDDEKNNFEEVFESLRVSRSIDIENLDSIFEKSYSIANFDTLPRTDFREQEFIGKLMTVTGGKGSSLNSRHDRNAKISADVKEFLIKNKLI